MSVLAVIAAPRFWGGGFDEARLFDEASSALRYAQRSAISMQRTVCASFTATTLTLTYDATYGSTTCGAAGLLGPGGAPAPYTVTAQGSATFTAFPASFTFDRVGRPSAAQTITVSGGRQILVEAESGYVH